MMKILLVFDKEVRDDDLDNWTSVIHSLQNIKTVTPVGDTTVLPIQIEMQEAVLRAETMNFLFQKIEAIKGKK